MPERSSTAIAVLALIAALSGCDSIGKAFDYASQDRDNQPRKAATRSGDGQAAAAGDGASIDPSLPAETTHVRALAAAQSPADMVRPRDTREATPPAPTKPFEFQSPDRGSSARIGADAGDDACAFAGLDLPANTQVYAAGAYGGRELDIQIDDSGHQATQMDVAVNQPDAPVVLMLGGYEPTVWNIGWSARTRILAVRVGGYHRQIVNGLPASTPLLISTYDNRHPCGHFYVSAANAAALNPIARRSFGRAIDQVHIAQNGKVQIGPDAGGWVTDRTARTPESFRVPDSQLAGPAGLEQALRMGLLRKAERSDGDAWLAATRPRDAPPVVGAPAPSMPLYNAYVVLKPLRLPAGLYGAHSASFFVPKGVARPSGELGHSTLYDFNTLACAGTACSRE